jgi:hypothetical protein
MDGLAALVTQHRQDDAEGDDTTSWPTMRLTVPRIEGRRTGRTAPAVGDNQTRFDQPLRYRRQQQMPSPRLPVRSASAAIRRRRTAAGSPGGSRCAPWWRIHLLHGRVDPERAGRT